MIGQKLNKRYEITAPLGEGAMGEVFQATDSQTQQQVAVKVLARQLTTNPDGLERFRREGETLRKLKHPSIVAFVDAFEYDKQYVIVMEYVPGGSLHDLIQKGPLPIERARQIALDLCDALIRAHRLNIIHRDIKPENVLIDQDGTPKLADFGVARLGEGTRMTRSGTQVGTPYYMAPEAWEGKTLDAQADIWSLGVVLFEMLSGQVPFGGDTGAAVMNKVLTTNPPDLKKLRAEVPKGLVNVVGHMLTHDRKRRFQSMREVGVDLERSQALTTPKAERERAEQPASRGPNPQPTIRRSIEALRAMLSRSPRLLRVAGLIGVAAIIIWSVSLMAPALFKAETASNASGTGAFNLGLGSSLIGKDGATLMYVPEGQFTMGSANGQPDEQPVHRVFLNAFWIDKFEVTNALFEKCVAEGACSGPSKKSSQTHSTYFGDSHFDNYPVIYVTWSMAEQYCGWADQRLPTEAEWEKAARGPNALTYPWGDKRPSINLLNFVGSVGDTTAVGRYPAGASMYGVYDLEGNVSEWVSSSYKPYPYNADDGREDLSSTDPRVFRGSMFADLLSDVRSTARNRDYPTLSRSTLGFRCAKSANVLNANTNSPATQTPVINIAVSPTSQTQISVTQSLQPGIPVISYGETLPFTDNINHKLGFYGAQGDVVSLYVTGGSLDPRIVAKMKPYLALSDNNETILIEKYGSGATNILHYSLPYTGVYYIQLGVKDTKYYEFIFRHEIP